MREKIVEFIRVHGYTKKSFVLAMFLFPPAAGYVAYKMPGIGRVQRVLLAVLGMLLAPVLVAIAVGQLVSLFKLYF